MSVVQPTEVLHRVRGSYSLALREFVHLGVLSFADSPDKVACVAYGSAEK
jgi:hypothetical protein